MNKIYDFKNKDIKIEFNSIKIGNSAYINQPIEVIEYIEYLQNQLQQKENIIKDIKSQLDYLETYSSEEDVFEDMKRRLDKINKIIGSDKKWIELNL